MAMMPAMPMPEEEQEIEETPAGGLEQGYTIELSCLPDGTFKVSEPEPLEVEAEDDTGEAPGSEMGEDFATIGEALKAIIGKIKENPVGNDGQKSFEAGYQA